MNKLSTMEQWRDRVAGALRRYTDLQMEEIAKRCYVAERTGENAAVWHQAALVANHPCNCLACKKLGKKRIASFSMALR